MSKKYIPFAKFSFNYDIITSLLLTSLENIEEYDFCFEFEYPEDFEIDNEFEYLNISIQERNYVVEIEVHNRINNFVNIIIDVDIKLLTINNSTTLSKISDFIINYYLENLKVQEIMTLSEIIN